MNRKDIQRVLMRPLRGLAVLAVALPLAAASAGEPVPVPPVIPAPCPCIPKKKTEPPTVTVKAIIDEDNGCEIKLGCRKAQVTPHRDGCTHTGGGNILVEQPDNDTIVITMTGGAVAYCSPLKGSHAGMSFDLNQAFKIECAECQHKKLKLVMEGRLIGVLRSHCKGGSAEVTEAVATVTCDDPAHPTGVLTVALPPHSAAGGENVSVNDKEGPCTIPVCCGCFTLHQTFNISATGPAKVGAKAPSVEFADGAIDPLWISYKEPFHGVLKKDFGFQIIVHLIAEDCDETAPPPPPPEKVPLPKD